MGDRTEEVAPTPASQQVEVGAKATNDSMAGSRITKETEEEVEVEGETHEDIEVGDAAREDIQVEDAAGEDIEVKDTSQEDVEDAGANPQQGGAPMNAPLPDLPPLGGTDDPHAFPFSEAELAVDMA